MDLDAVTQGQEVSSSAASIVTILFLNRRLARQNTGVLNPFEDTLWSTFKILLTYHVSYDTLGGDNSP